MLLLAAALSIAQQLAKLQRLDWSGKFVKPAYVVFDRWPDHKARTIFATMMNGDENALEVVAYHVTRGGVLQRRARYHGDVRTIALRDITGDGVSELLVGGSPGNRSAGLVILRWDGRKFHDLGEISTNASFIDIDGDGVPEVIEASNDTINECAARTGPVFVRKLKNGHFEEVERPRLLAVDEVANGTRNLYWFLPDSVSTSCLLRVINKGGRTITLTLRDEDGDADDPIVVHDGVQPIELPSRCTTAEVTLTGPRTAKIVLLLEAK